MFPTEGLPQRSRRVRGTSSTACNDFASSGLLTAYPKTCCPPRLPFHITRLLPEALPESQDPSTTRNTHDHSQHIYICSSLPSHLVSPSVCLKPCPLVLEPLVRRRPPYGNRRRSCQQNTLQVGEKRTGWSLGVVDGHMLSPVSAGDVRTRDAYSRPWDARVVETGVRAPGNHPVGK